ncbi:MAG: tRNA pseudouridine(55) synthase TruB [bacterium]|nr:tRNA pseudouridine(55) synthase TruB [bacterium]
MESRIFAIWKPKGPTSNAVLNDIRRIVGRKEKVGHAGTLDPLAEGILVVAIGREATKQLAEAVKKEKEYIAKIHLGATSSTDDEEGEKTGYEVNKPPNKQEVRDAVVRFVGDIMQTPPIYSAIKIEGKEAYKYARKGEPVTMKPRSAHVESIEVQEYAWPYLTLRVVTGPGVYIRSLARDIGEYLKVGGYLAGLTRTRVGEFRKENIYTLDDIRKQQ